MEGLILKGVGGFYTVRDEAGGRYTLRAQGKLRRQRMTPMVGDRVKFTVGRDEENSWLTEVLPRRNNLMRPPVANIDRIVLTVAASTPKPDLAMIDRLLLMSFQADIAPIVCVNKADQDEAEAQKIARQYAGACRVYTTCAESGAGVGALREALAGTVHAFGGQSGVGKSTLINALYGMTLCTGTLSEKIDRGRHTTRHVELIEVPGGGMVLDTPGFSLLELRLSEPLELKKRYPEFALYEDKCRFSPCAHHKEPGCAVKAAVAAGEIDAERYARYGEIFKEMTLRWRERYD